MTTRLPASYAATTEIGGGPATVNRAPWEVYRQAHRHGEFDEAVVRVDGPFDLTDTADRAVLYHLMESVHTVLYPALGWGMETGATYGELVEVLELWHKVLADTAGQRRAEPGRHHRNVAACVAEYTQAVCDLIECISNSHTEAGPDKSSEPLAWHRREVGLCPDGGDHWYGDCGLYECRTWRDDEAAEAVYTPVAELWMRA